jgi:tetratricopeptide (TPR) repeat protein
MNKIITILALSLISLAIYAQNEKKLVRQGNNLYKDEKYSDAEISYRKALEKKANSTPAEFNLGNSLYKQKKMEEAADQFNHLASDGQLTNNQKSMVYHNLGNTMLQSQKFQESVDAYKKALRNNPYDMETKYNLAVAQKMLKNPTKQNQQNKNNKKDKKDNKDKNKDKDKQNQDKQDQDKQNQQDKNQQQQPQAGKLSKEDAKRMLQAIQNDENNTQDKLKKEKAMSKKVRPAIDW